MANFFLTKKAVEDITSIWEYTYEEWSEVQADKYYLLIIGTCKKIALTPNIGKNYFEISKELFGFRVGKHINFFRKINKKDIEIVRILHERMDLKNRLY